MHVLMWRYVPRVNRTRRCASPSHHLTNPESTTNRRPLIGPDSRGPTHAFRRLHRRKRDIRCQTSKHCRAASSVIQPFVASNFCADAAWRPRISCSAHNGVLYGIEEVGLWPFGTSQEEAKICEPTAPPLLCAQICCPEEQQLGGSIIYTGVSST